MLFDIPDSLIRTRRMKVGLAALGLVALMMAMPAHAKGPYPWARKPKAEQPRTPAEKDPYALKTRIMVTVLEPNGEPLKQAVVLVADGAPNTKPGHNRYFAIAKARWVRRLTTDQRGQATSPPLYPGAYHLMALPVGGGLTDAKGTIGSEVRVVAAVKDQTVKSTLELRRGGKLNGVVSDDEKKPLAGAPLILGGAGFTRRGSSGAGGRFTFAGLYPGEYTLRPDQAGGLPISGKPLAIQIQMGKTTEAKLVVEQSATVLVYVLRRGAGTESAEVALRLVRSDPAMAAGDEGQRASVPKGKINCSFKNVSPGKYMLLAEASPGCKVEPAKSVVVARGGRFSTVRLAVVTGTSVSRENVKKGSLRIRLTAPGKAPVKDVEFTVADNKSGKELVRLKTDGVGLCDFQLPAGEYRIRVTQASGWAVTPSSVTVRLRAGGRLEKAFSAALETTEDF